MTSGSSRPPIPRADKTLCDEADVLEKARAVELFEAAIDGGLVSESTTALGFPKQMWVVEGGRVFEAMHGGDDEGSYHGYPIRKSDPFSVVVLRKWNAQ